MPKLKKLFEPIKVGSLIFKNRIVMAPAHNILPSAEGEVTQAMCDYFSARAKGGAAMITVGIFLIHPDGRGIVNQPRIDDDRFIPVRDQDMPEEVAPEDEESFQDLSGLNVTGRNFASTTFNKIENQIQDAYESLADEEDRTLYKDYMLTNLKLYFDRFEEELQPTVPEPESPDYNK